MAEIDIVLEGIDAQIGGEPILRQVSTRFVGGAITSVLGPSGCGKTTLLRVIAGLLRPTAGRVLIAGKDTTEDDPWSRRVGMVFQGLSLYPHLTVRANLEFPLRGRGGLGGWRARARECIAEVAELFEFATLLDRYPSELSGGQQQRVALGRAVIAEPRILLLDEPFSHLDAPLRLRLREVLLKWLARTHTTCLLVTHDAADAMAMADRMVVMADGQIIQEGLPEELYCRPVNRFVSRLTGAVPTNDFSGRLVADGIELESLGQTLRTTGLQWSEPDGSRVDVVVRAADFLWEIPAEPVEQSRFSVNSGGRLSRGSALSLSGTVCRCHRWEDRWFVVAEVQNGAGGCEVSGVYHGPRPEVGTPVRGVVRGVARDEVQGAGGAGAVELGLHGCPMDDTQSFREPAWLVFDSESGRRLLPSGGDHHSASRAFASKRAEEVS